MNRNFIYLSLFSLSLTACSTVSIKHASGDFDYANKAEIKGLSTPDGLLKPNEKQDFYVPEVVESNAPVGVEMDIRAPSLVIPIAAASRIEGNEGEAKVWFDQVIDSKNLLNFIRDAIKSQLATDGVALSPTDESHLVLTSDWYKSTKESGWLFKEIEETQEMRFKYTLEAKPHGRSVAIKVDLIDYNKKDASGSVTNINSIEKHRAEMTMLNTLIGEVDYQYRIYKHEVLQAKAKQVNVSLGSNTEGHPALIVNMDLDSLWSSVTTFYRDNGFEITDLNESKNIYFVSYEKEDKGFWGGLFSDEKVIIDIPDGKYQFVFTDFEDKTNVMVFDDNKNRVSAEMLQSILPALEKGLSFESLF